MNRTIYLDNAATTQLFPEVLEAMLPYYDSRYGNPSSVYELGEESRQTVEAAREQIADTLSADPDTIFFTSGGTESDNWALRFAAEHALSGDPAAKRERPHIITTAIEHHAILRTCEVLEKEGVHVTFLPVNPEGIVDLAAMERAIRPETAVVSVMYANNEIGTLQPIRQAATIAHSHGVLFHTDAVQAYGQIPIDPAQLGIDLMSASGHKLNGPKGIGFLYVRKGLDITPIIRGGSQERGKRAGTENVPGIVGMGCAARISNQMMRQKMQRETALRDYMIRRLLREIPDLKLNGSARMRLPNNINCCIRGVNGGALVALMDLEGICISAASACSAGSSTPSHVQLAIGNTPAEARTAIRITLGYQTTREEIDIATDTLKRLVTKLRSMS
ncbi:MAG: cysteine desulfurase [Clostridiales bacterium]|nr:cysteine desulfurase [Clostridiales bacterium]